VDQAMLHSYEIIISDLNHKLQATTKQFKNQLKTLKD
jgi:hypothetical protein